MHDTQLIQLVLDGLGVAVLVEELVGDDEGALLAHGAQLVQSNRHAPALEVNLFRGAVPQHIGLPLCHNLSVNEMLHAYILGDGVAAPGAAAQGHGRLEAEVVEVADTALGAGGVDDDAAGLHGLGVLGHLLLLIHGVDVEGGGVAVTAVSDELLGLGDGVVEVLGMVHGQHRRELLVSELLGELHGVHLANEHLGVLGHVHTGHLSDGVSGLTHDLGVQSTVDDDGLAHLVQLVALQEVGATTLELVLDLLVDVVQHDHRLLGSANHAVVKGLGVQDGHDGQLDVGRGVDDGGGVASADA